MQIDRTSLRGQVRSAIRKLIFDGRLRPGASVREPVLAATLGVSRTPLREALLELQGQGLVRSEPGRGFFVVPLSVKMIQEVYPLLGALERLAVRLAGDAVVEACSDLSAINGELLDAAGDPRRQFEVDRRWHERLVEHCPSERVVQMIRSETDHVRRFDGAVRRGVADLRSSCADHAAVVALIERGEIEAAADRLERHWLSCVEPVARWLRAELERCGQAT